MLHSDHLEITFEGKVETQLLTAQSVELDRFEIDRSASLGLEAVGRSIIVGQTGRAYIVSKEEAEAFRVERREGNSPLLESLLSNSSFTLHDAKIKESTCLISGRYNESSVNSVGRLLGVEPIEKEYRKFDDREIRPSFGPSLRGKTPYLIVSLHDPVDEQYVSLEHMLDALQRSSCSNARLIIPYMGYSRQDRRVPEHASISFVRRLENLRNFDFLEQIVTIDLHNQQAAGVFPRNFNNIYATPLFLDFLERRFSPDELGNIVVMGPDEGSSERSRAFATGLRSITGGYVPAFHAKKIRDRVTDGVKSIELLCDVRDIKDKRVFVVDDLVNNGDTSKMCARKCLEMGANEIVLCVPHLVCPNNALQLLRDSADDIGRPLFSLILGTDTVPSKISHGERIIKLSTAPLLAEVIRRMGTDESLSEMTNPSFRLPK